MIHWYSLLILTGFIICGSSYESTSTTITDVQINPASGRSEENNVTITCISDGPDLYYNFTWVRYTGERVHIAAKNDELLSPNENQFSFYKINGNLNFKLKVTGVARWETGLFGCRRAQTVETQLSTVKAASTEIEDYQEKLISPTFQKACEPNVTDPSLTDRVAAVGVYRVHYYGENDPNLWYIKCDDDGDELECTTSYTDDTFFLEFKKVFLPTNLTGAVRCEYKRMFDIHSSEKGKVFAKKRYYPEGTTLTFKCLSKIDSGITWMWRRSDEGVENVLARDGSLLSGVKILLGDRYTISQLNNIYDLQENTLTITDAKPYDSGTYICQTSNEEIAISSSKIIVAGKLSDTSVTMTTSAPLKAAGQVEITNGDKITVTCVTHAANVQPTVVVLLGNRTLQKYMEPNPVVQTDKDEGIRDLEMYEDRHRVTVTAREVPISCDDFDKTLTCTATAPVNQFANKDMKIKVTGCGDNTGAATVVFATRLYLLLYMIPLLFVVM